MDWELYVSLDANTGTGWEAVTLRTSIDTHGMGLASLRVWFGRGFLGVITCITVRRSSHFASVLFIIMPVDRQTRFSLLSSLLYYSRPLLFNLAWTPTSFAFVYIFRCRPVSFFPGFLLFLNG